MAEGYKDWSAGDILTAADLEDYTVKQSVLVFADASARTSALSSVLREGMVSYLKDTDETQVYDGSAWSAVGGGKILQVVQATKNDTWSASVASAGSSAITDLAVTITPSSTSSTILLFGMVNGTQATNGRFAVGIHRGATVLGTYDSPGLRTGVFGQNSRPDSYIVNTVSIAFQDSPASTSAQTYQAYAYNLVSATRTMYVNRSAADDNTAYAIRTFPNLTAVEVSA